MSEMCEDTENESNNNASSRSETQTSSQSNPPTDAPKVAILVKVVPKPKKMRKQDDFAESKKLPEKGVIRNISNDMRSSLYMMGFSAVQHKYGYKPCKSSILNGLAMNEDDEDDETAPLEHEVDKWNGYHEMVREYEEDNGDDNDMRRQMFLSVLNS